MQIHDTIRAAAAAAAVRVLTEALLRRYGPTMSASDLSGLLGIGASGLRMRRQRGSDLPPHIGDLNAMSWSTARVALWLVGLQPEDHPDSSITPQKRRRSRTSANPPEHITGESHPCAN